VGKKAPKKTPGCAIIVAAILGIGILASLERQFQESRAPTASSGRTLPQPPVDAEADYLHKVDTAVAGLRAVHPDAVGEDVIVNMFYDVADVLGACM
jgi:hypothetical protein